MAKARRRIKIFSSLGIVVLVALIVLAVVSVGLMAKAGIISGDGMKLQPPTAPASGATALLGVVGAIAR